MMCALYCNLTFRHINTRGYYNTIVYYMAIYLESSIESEIEAWRSDMDVSRVLRKKLCLLSIKFRIERFFFSMICKNFVFFC